LLWALIRGHVAFTRESFGERLFESVGRSHRDLPATLREAGKLAEDAVKIAIAQVAEAMDQIPHQERSDR